MKDRLWKQVCSWNGKFLSRVGKEILVKSIAQAIPFYVMSVFAIPVCLCDKMKRMMNSFWWDSNSTDRRKTKI